MADSGHVDVPKLSDCLSERAPRPRLRVGLENPDLEAWKDVRLGAHWLQRWMR